MTSSTHKESYGIFVPQSGMARSAATMSHPFVEDPRIKPEEIQTVIGGIRTERDLPQLVSVSDKVSLGNHVCVPMLRRVGNDLTVLGDASAPSLLVVGGGILINGPGTTFPELRFIGGTLLYRGPDSPLPFELNTDSELRRRIVPQLHAMGIGSEAALLRALQFEASEAAVQAVDDETIDAGPNLGL